MTVDTATDAGQQIARMRARLGDGPVLVGPSAAWALGLRSAADGDPGHRVHITGVSPRRTATLVAHRMALSPGDVVVGPAGQCTGTVRTAVDLARGVGTAHLGVEERVALLDGFLYSVRLPVADARVRASTESGLWGLFTARRVLSLARDGVQSPKETELRLLLRRQRWPEPVVQCPVVSRAGNVVAHLDLGWPEYRVGVEYDGAAHRDGRRHADDMDRHNAIRRAGWIILQVGPRLLAHPDRLFRELGDLLSAAGYPVIVDKSMTLRS